MSTESTRLTPNYLLWPLERLTLSQTRPNISSGSYMGHRSSEVWPLWCLCKTTTDQWHFYSASWGERWGKQIAAERELEDSIVWLFFLPGCCHIRNCQMPNQKALPGLLRSFWLKPTLGICNLNTFTRWKTQSVQTPPKGFGKTVSSQYTHTNTHRKDNYVKKFEMPLPYYLRRSRQFYTLSHMTPAEEIMCA